MISLICCNGRPPDHKLLKRVASDSGLIIAADGGARTLLDAGIVPDVVTGDMDSFQTEDNGLPSSTEILPDSDQETNDLEKALHLASGRGSTEVLILGAGGFRLDHTLKNLSVMQQFDDLFTRIIMLDDYVAARLIPSPFRMQTKPGTAVSLFPLSGRVEGIITKGLRYPLNDEPLENGLRDGSSNEATQAEIEISYRSGALLLMIPSAWPLPL